MFPDYQILPATTKGYDQYVDWVRPNEFVTTREGVKLVSLESLCIKTALH